jgi:hypothetical protein
LVCCLGCRSRQPETKVEVDRVLFAVDSLRKAENDEKAELLTVLEGLSVESDEAKNIKKMCADAYGLHVSTLAELRAIKSGLSARGASPSAHPSFAALGQLKGAEAQLERARELTRRCADVEGELRRKYGLK